MIYYNKLVRDRIPEIMREKGEVPHLEILDDAAYRCELLKKLDEEVAEYKESGETEELADILEVLLALAKAQGVSAEELQSVCNEKRKARGGFAKRIFLIGKE